MQLSKKPTSSLEGRHTDTIRRIAVTFPEIRSVILFGSRAAGNSEKGSDIDLALIGEDVTHSTVLRFYDFLNEETLIPYYIDVIDYKTIQNAGLKEHIDQVGIIIYEK
ncbi:MAG: nucleotidyltransferase domain-containing protein [Balneolaceae bacterium]|nr:MAG: nucleotidyltransferase domain-containing protein [Balneolaceae bacterium]